MQTPTWLEARGGALKQRGADFCFVMFGNEPQYSLTATPVAGKFGCVIRQTINGKRIADANVYPTIEAALQGGLQTLATALGWSSLAANPRGATVNG